MQSIRKKDILLKIYTSLLNQSTDEFTISMLSRLQTAEMKAKNRLEADFVAAYGSVPVYTTEQADISYESFLDGILLALRNNSQNITFELEIIDQLGEGRLGHELYNYLLRADMAQQDLLNTLYTYYLHAYQL